MHEREALIEGKLREAYLIAGHAAAIAKESKIKCYVDRDYINLDRE